MRSFYLIVLGCWLAFTAAAQETLVPDQLKPGMKGYGLSVFRGTKPERFEVEIVGVLKNAFPKQDMILIKMSGANLEHHKIIAGMSGSPIYIDGTLIGALAYGWSFENDPLAGVTPIHNMLAEIDRQAEPGAPVPAGSEPDATAPQRMLTPLSLGGFSSRIVERMAEEFRPYGLLPVAGGGGSPLERRNGDRQVVTGEIRCGPRPRWAKRVRHINGGRRYENDMGHRNRGILGNRGGGNIGSSGGECVGAL